MHAGLRLNELGYPVIYHAAHKGNGDLFKLLVDAGARVDVLVPRMTWIEQTSEVVCSDFVTIEAHSTPYGDLKVHTGKLKPEFSGGDALWKAYQARGLTTPLLHYVASTCTEFRSQGCWQMLGIMFDKGGRPPRDFLHRFFRSSAGGYFFTIHPDFPEAAAGLDRMIALGASLNATDNQGGRRSAPPTAPSAGNIGS